MRRGYFFTWLLLAALCLASVVHSKSLLQSTSRNTAEEDATAAEKELDSLQRQLEAGGGPDHHVLNRRSLSYGSGNNNAQTSPGSPTDVKPAAAVSSIVDK